MNDKLRNIKLAIIGLGYVWLPLALEFAKKRKVIGFDIKTKRVKDLQSGIDKNLEFNNDELQHIQIEQICEIYRIWLFYEYAIQLSEHKQYQKFCYYIGQVHM